MSVARQGVPLHWVMRHSAGAIAEGISREQLLERSLIETESGSQPAEVLPAHYLLFWLNTAFSVEDAAHGLGLDRIRMGSSALAVRVMLGCATLEGAIRAVERFYARASSSAQIKLDADGEQAMVSIFYESRIETAGAIMEDVSVAWLFMCCSCFLGRPLPVTEVTTRDPTHFNLGRRHWAVKAPVRLGNVAALRFPKALLGSRRGGHSSDEALWSCIRPWLRFVEDGRAAPVAATGEPGVSAHSAMPPTGSRERGYRQSRQRALADAGLALLRGSEASVDAVAAELGYADARSFRRFMKSSTGLTPQEIRQAPGSLAPHPDVAARIREMTVLLDP